MNSTGYDELMNRLILELDHEYPNLVKLRSIIEESNCPYLLEKAVAKANTLKNKVPVKK